MQQVWQIGLDMPACVPASVCVCKHTSITRLNVKANPQSKNIHHPSAISLHQVLCGLAQSHFHRSPSLSGVRDLWTMHTECENGFQSFETSPDAIARSQLSLIHRHNTTLTRAHTLVILNDRVLNGSVCTQPLSSKLIKLHIFYSNGMVHSTHFQTFRVFFSAAWNPHPKWNTRCKNSPRPAAKAQISTERNQHIPWLKKCRVFLADFPFPLWFNHLEAPCQRKGQQRSWCVLHFRSVKQIGPLWVGLAS